MMTPYKPHELPDKDDFLYRAVKLHKKNFPQSLGEHELAWEIIEDESPTHRRCYIHDSKRQRTFLYSGWVDKRGYLVVSLTARGPYMKFTWVRYRKYNYASGRAKK